MSMSISLVNKIEYILNIICTDVEIIFHPCITTEIIITEGGGMIFNINSYEEENSIKRTLVQFLEEYYEEEFDGTLSIDEFIPFIKWKEESSISKLPFELQKIDEYLYRKLQVPTILTPLKHLGGMYIPLERVIFLKCGQATEEILKHEAVHAVQFKISQSGKGRLLFPKENFLDCIPRSYIEFYKKEYGDRNSLLMEGEAFYLQKMEWNDLRKLFDNFLE